MKQALDRLPLLGNSGADPGTTGASCTAWGALAEVVLQLRSAGVEEPLAGQPAAVHRPTGAQEQSNLPGAHSEGLVVHSEGLLQLPVPISTSCTGVGQGALARCALRGTSALPRHQDNEKRMLELSGEDRRGLPEEPSTPGLLVEKGTLGLVGE